jgi:hypothetical protein
LERVGTWDELQKSGLAVTQDTMALDTRYAWIGHYGDSTLFRYPGYVWFFSDVYAVPKAVSDSTGVPVFAQGELVVVAVVGRPICTENRPRRISAVELGLVDPTDPSNHVGRHIRGLCVPFGSLTGIHLPRGIVVAA